MSGEFRRGMAAIEEAQARKGGGSFSYVPRLRWREDGESHYVLVLTDIEDVVTILLHEWVPCGKFTKADGEEGTSWQDFLSRKDPYLGEDYDDLEERLEREPKLRCMGVVVELEPVYETTGGRKRVKEFVVKTEDYVRKTDDGEEEITQPSLALVTESAITLWGAIGSLDQSRGPVAELPVEIIRRGTDQNTRYDLFPLEAPVDLTPIMDYLDGISYLAEEVDEIVNKINGTNGELEAAQVVADALLSRRLAELADGERYEELVSPLNLDEMPKQKFKKNTKKSEPKTRPARTTKRQTTAKAESAPEAGSQDNGEATEVSETREDRFAALKARVEGNK